MGLDFLISITCLIAATGLGISLAIFNLKRLAETHDERMEIYRRRKRLKNQALRQFWGIPEPKEDRRDPEATCTYEMDL